jgi:hypothetical protein
VTAQPALALLPVFPLPVSDAHSNKDQRDYARQPRLIGSSSRKAKHSVDQPEKGKYEPDRRTPHFFGEHSTERWSKAFPGVMCAVAPDLNQFHNQVAANFL